ncbi:UNVERIFIED_CONTAM: transporter, cation channel family protein [Hammondia hammondi]|eukprot:XP_008885893.1 transporter, cation channel family protein [Hammondia hammondi]
MAVNASLSPSLASSLSSSSLSCCSSSSSSSSSSSRAENGMSSMLSRTPSSPSQERRGSPDASLCASVCSSFFSFASSSPPSASSSLSSLPPSLSSPPPSLSSLPSSLSSSGGDLRRAAACWVYSVSLLGQQPALPGGAFRTRRQQKAFYLFLRLQPLVKLALCLYLLLAFFEDSDSSRALKKNVRTSSALSATRHAVSPSSPAAQCRLDASPSSSSSFFSPHSSYSSSSSSPSFASPSSSSLSSSSCASSSSVSPLCSSAWGSPVASAEAPRASVAPSLSPSAFSASISRHESDEETAADWAASAGSSRRGKKMKEEDREKRDVGTRPGRGEREAARGSSRAGEATSPLPAFFAPSGSFSEGGSRRQDARFTHKSEARETCRHTGDADRLSRSSRTLPGGVSPRIASPSCRLLSSRRKEHFLALAPNACVCSTGRGEDKERRREKEREKDPQEKATRETSKAEIEGTLPAAAFVSRERPSRDPHTGDWEPRRPLLPAFLFRADSSSLHSPSPESLLPELDPWSQRTIVLALSFLCLGVLLLAALLECLYRGEKSEDEPRGAAPRGEDDAASKASGGKEDRGEGGEEENRGKGRLLSKAFVKQTSSVSVSLDETSGRGLLPLFASQPFTRLLILACLVVSLLDLFGVALVFFVPSLSCTDSPREQSEAACAREELRAFLAWYKPGVAARLVRPLLLALFYYPVIGMLLRIVRTLPKVRTIILAALLSVLLFDWLGVILFAGTSGHDEFNSFQSGCISLLLVVTTVRLPQVLLRGYTVHEVAVLFIVVFYLLTAVLLGLFAAAFYTAYRDGDIADSRKQLALSSCYLNRAFNLLLASQETCVGAPSLSSPASAKKCLLSSEASVALGRDPPEPETREKLSFQTWRAFYAHYAALSGRPHSAPAGDRGSILELGGDSERQNESRLSTASPALHAPLPPALASSLVSAQLTSPFLRLLSSPSSDSGVGEAETDGDTGDKVRRKMREAAEDDSFQDLPNDAQAAVVEGKPNEPPEAFLPSQLLPSEQSLTCDAEVYGTRQTLSAVSRLPRASPLSATPATSFQTALATTGTAATRKISGEAVSRREEKPSQDEEGEEEEGAALLWGRERGDEKVDGGDEQLVERGHVKEPKWRGTLASFFGKRQDVASQQFTGKAFCLSGRRGLASWRLGAKNVLAGGGEETELFSLLQRGAGDNACGLARCQFAQLVSILAAYDAAKQKEEQRLWRSDSCRFALHRRVLNVVADVCVVASLILTYMQTRKFIRKASTLSGEEIESSPVDLAEGLPASCFGSVAGAYWIQNALSFVYLVSVVVRIRVTSSIQRYTGFSLRERFDIVVGGGVMILELACLWAGSASAFHPSCTTETFDDLSRSLAFIRVLRGIRICFRISPLRKMIVSLVAAVAALETVLLVLVVIFCAYGTVGMELFGGIIKCDMEHLPPKGPDMEDPTDWGVLNFNDFFASLVTLFLLTVNGWDDSLKALVKHTSVFSCGAYFVSFYILTDTIILNLLVALVLEAYDQVASSSSSSWRPVL